MRHRSFWPGSIKNGPFATCSTDFVPIVFHLFTHPPIINHFLLPMQERGRLIMGNWNSPNLSETWGFECLGHSNWTICSLLSQFYSLNFPTSTSLYWGVQFLLPQTEKGWKWEDGILQLLHLHTGEPNSYYPRERKANNGKLEFSQPEWETGVWVPGALKLDHLQPVKPILFPKFSNFYIFILRGPILITPERERLKMGSRNSPTSSSSYWRAQFILPKREEG